MMNATQDQIIDWKKQHKKVIKVASEEEEIAYFKTPTLAEIDVYNEKKEEDIYKALQYLFDTCVLEDKEYEDEFLLAASKSLIHQTFVDNKYEINTVTGTDEIKKSAALVRHYFQIDPYDLPIDEFYKLLAEALWLQDHKNKQLELAIANVLVRTFSNQMT